MSKTYMMNYENYAANVFPALAVITAGHTERVSNYVSILLKKIAEKNDFYKISKDDIPIISAASKLHDIGKIKISENILDKKEQLSSDEINSLKTHPVLGAEIIAAQNDYSFDNKFLNYALDISMYHHEKWNGDGYPKRLSETDIPLLARITAVADIYDALSSSRAYKSAYTHNDTVEIIYNEKGYKLDPKLTDIFIECCDEFYKCNKYMSSVFYKYRSIPIDIE